MKNKSKAILYKCFQGVTGVSYWKFCHIGKISYSTLSGSLFKIEEGLYVICTSTRYYLYLQAKRLMNVKVFTPPQLKKKEKRSGLHASLTFKI